MATIDHKHLPLHVQIPPVPTLSWDIADNIIATAASNGDSAVWTAMTRVYREEAAAKAAFSNRFVQDDVWTDATVFGTDMELMIQSGFAIDSGMTVEQFEHQHPNDFAYVKLFQVIETREEQDRRRIISWPASINHAERSIKQDLELKHAKVKFDTATEVRNRGAKHAYAASLDFKKFFQEFLLVVKRFWAFKHHGRVFFLHTVPTGAVGPPLSAQALSRTLLALAVRLANATEHVEHDSCIDNLRLCSNELNAIWASWFELLRLIKTLGATIGEMHPPPDIIQYTYKYLGMIFECVNEQMQVYLSPKSIAKMTAAAELLRSKAPLTVVECQAIFGYTIWASTVTGSFLGSLFHVIKFIRRIQKKTHHEVVTVWPSIVELWASFLIQMTEMRFTRPQKSDCKATLYTDASESGWGVVVIDLYDRPLRIFAGKWSDQEASHSINHLELRALRIGIRILATLKDPMESLEVTAFIDNTTARSWATRRRASTFISNSVATEIEQILQASGVQLASLSYVESARNIADSASRLFQDNCRPT